MASLPSPELHNIHSIDLLISRLRGTRPGIVRGSLDGESFSVDFSGWNFLTSGCQWMLVDVSGSYVASFIWDEVKVL